MILALIGQLGWLRAGYQARKARCDNAAFDRVVQRATFSNGGCEIAAEGITGANRIDWSD